MNFPDLRSRYQLIEKILIKEKSLLSEKERKEYFRIIPRYINQLNILEKEYGEAFERALDEFDEDLEDDDPRLRGKFKHIEEGYQVLKASIEDMEKMIMQAKKKQKERAKEKADKAAQMEKEFAKTEQSLWEALDELEGLFKECERSARIECGELEKKEKKENGEYSVKHVDLLEESESSDDDFHFPNISPLASVSGEAPSHLKKPARRRNTF